MKTIHKLGSARTVAIGAAILATIIWASSFVFVKIILADIGPLSIAGLRYFIGFLVLLPFMLNDRASIGKISRRLWLQLFLIGISAYAIGNGALFWGLKYLPATTASFLMSITPLLILFAGVIVLREFPTRLQVVGVVISLLGGVLFFATGLSVGEPLGLALVAIGLIGFTTFGILGRSVARDRRTGTIVLTGIPLAIGGGVLLILSIPIEGWPILNQNTLSIILWLAIVNTALAYVLYNFALKSLTALEMNVILNLSPLGTAVLAWLILGEDLSAIQIFGIIIVILGVSLVQLAGNHAKLDPTRDACRFDIE
jgi:drug/metabolite transporter (DMT)-like permease